MVLPPSPFPGVSDDPAPLDQLEAVAKDLRARPDVVHRHLRDLLHDDERLAIVAGRSYRHVNGFAKVRMVEGCGYSARLHIWEPGEDRLGDSDPHGHRWEFASWVAAGDGIDETYWAETDPGDSAGARFLRHRYVRTSDGAGDLTPVDTAWLRPEKDIEHECGKVYVCPLAVVHTVAPRGRDLTVTVVVQGRIAADSTDVFRRPGPAPDELERPLRVPELRRLLRRVDEVLPG